MANIDAALKELEKLKHEYQDAINHDETILVSTVFVLLRNVLEAMREPLPNDDRPITRGQAEKIVHIQYGINKRLGDLESKIGGEKKKWRDQVDRRLDKLEGKPFDSNGSPSCIYEDRINVANDDGMIKIDRKIAERWRKNPFQSVEIQLEIDRALKEGR